MKRKIVTYGNEILRKKSLPITEITAEIAELAEDMLQLMHQEQGVGLAASQVGVSLQMFTINIESLNINDLVILNPEIIFKSENKETAEEGCLSFPGITGDITRPERIILKGIDLEKKPFEFECEGLIARAIQHEIDHLQGILFIDRMSIERRTQLKKRLNKLKREAKE